MPRPILFLDPIGGIAGDMFLAAAFALGVSPRDVEKALSGLRVGGFSLRTSTVVRHEISGVHVDVVVAEPEHHPHRSLSEILSLIGGCHTLSPQARDRAQRVFRALGDAEAKVHNVPVETIHFHEVGAVDSIVDICGAVAVLDALGDPEVYCRPPPLGSGSVRGAHGTIPIPPPATLELLRNLPVRFEGEGELTTPTGAALVATLAKVETPPNMRVQRVGYGVGTKDWKDRPNVLRAVLGEVDEKQASVWELSVNLDDATPQLIGVLLERLLEMGALDAWVLPATMKKGRPGHVLGALVDAAKRDVLVNLLLAESTTLGVRYWPVERATLERQFETVETPYGAVRIKVGLRDGERLNAAPEFEDCRARAKEHGVPVKEVWAAALRLTQGA
ncbi:MAG: nickel pincer cofactor biosynthesis protein LarC [Myxococcaceae bacterium]